MKLLPDQRLGPSASVADARVRFIAACLIATPIINALADISTNYFPAGVQTPGGLRGLLLLVLVVVATAKQLVMEAFVVPIYLFLALVFTLVLYSTDVGYALGTFGKVSTALMMLPVGYRYIRTWRDLRRLSVALFIASSLIAVYLLAAQTLKLGQSVYLKDSFYVGEANVQTTYVLALTVFLAPVIVPSFRTSRQRIFVASSIVGFLLVTLLVLRRTSLLALAGGYFVYFLLTPAKLRGMRRIAIAGTILLATAPFYLDVLAPRVEARIANRQLSSEARYSETFVALDDALNRSTKHTLVGSEPFNSQFLYQTRRPMHVDYNILLSGTGIIGVALYVSMYIAIFTRQRRNSGRLRERPYKEVNAVLYGLLAMSLIISFAGSLDFMGFRVALFLYIGGLLGIQRAALHCRPDLQWSGLTAQSKVA